VWKIFTYSFTNIRGYQMTNGMLEILIPCMKLCMTKANVMIVGCCIDIRDQYRALA